MQLVLMHDKVVTGRLAANSHCISSGILKVLFSGTAMYSESRH